MGCAVGTVKFAVFIFNFLLVCLGFAMVLFGALDSSVPEGFDNIKDVGSQLSITSKVLMIAGGIIFVIAFFGCWGAVSDSSCMLFLYAVFLMILILVEAAVGVYVFVHKDTFKEKVSESLKTWMHEYNDQTTNAKTIIDNIQNTVQCCGVDSPNDWQSQIGSIPSSCCGKDEKTSCDMKRAYKEGCLAKGLRIIHQKINKYFWIVGAIVGVEVLTVIFALIVRNSILNEQRRSLA